MKVWFERSKFELEERVRRELRAMDREMERRGHISYQGIAVHQAKFPHTCEDCGQTYWGTEDHYYFHKNCPAKKREVGF